MVAQWLDRAGIAPCIGAEDQQCQRNAQLQEKAEAGDTSRLAVCVMVDSHAACDPWRGAT